MKNSKKKTSKVKNQTLVTSIRMSETEKETIQRKAAEKGVSVNKFIVNASLRAEKSLTPEIIVGVQNITNHAYEIVKESNASEAKKIQKEVNALWQKL